MKGPFWLLCDALSLELSADVANSAGFCEVLAVVTQLHPTVDFPINVMAV